MTARRNTIPTAVQQWRNIAGPLQRISDPRSLRSWAFLSQSKMAGVLEMFGYKCSRFTVAHYEGGRPVPERARLAYAAALTWRVEQETCYQFTAALSKHWKVAIKRRCACGRYFEPERSNILKCKRCRR